MSTRSIRRRTFLWTAGAALAPRLALARIARPAKAWDARWIHVPAMAPADYERKQTLVNAERFTTPELKEYERKILTAHDRCIEIEKREFAALRTAVLAAASRIRR